MSKNKNKHRQQPAPVKKPDLPPTSGVTPPAPVGIAPSLNPGELVTPVQAAQAIRNSTSLTCCRHSNRTPSTRSWI